MAPSPPPPTRTIEPDPLRIVEANTVIHALPLLPEIRLRLMRDDSPMLRGDVFIFAPEGPRPYWAFAWGGGQALARYLLDHPHIVRGRRVLDLGSGSGVAAIAASLGGASSVVAIDKDPCALAAIRLNAELNGAVVSIERVDLLKNRLEGSYDVALAADLFYDSGEMKWLFRIAGRVPLTLGADPMHRGLPKRYCEVLAKYAVRTVPDVEADYIAEAEVYRLHPPALPPLPDSPRSDD